MSARQPFFPVRPGSESQGTAHQKTFLIDSSNPLHLTSQTIPAANQSESTKISLSVPGPFLSNGANSVPQVKNSGLGGLLKKKSTHNLSQSAENLKVRTGSLNSLAFLDHGDVRPGTADPRSEAHQDRAKALETHGFGYQKASRHSLDLLDAGSIVRPGTVAPQSRALQDYTAGLDIRAPIPKPAAHSSSAFMSQNSMSRFPFSLVKLRGCTVFSDRIPENDTHISTTETKNGASRKVDNIGDLAFHSSTKGSTFNQNGPQRVPIEQQFSQYNTSEVDHTHLNVSMTGHEVTDDGRVKMSVFGQTKKRNRDEIEEDGAGSHWVDSQAKRHKSRHREEFETRGYAKSPPFSPRPERTSSRASGDVRRHFPDARGSPRSPRYRERRTTSPVNERHMPPYESIQAEQVAPDDTGNAFEKLLGRNTDTFVKQNMEKYDRLVKKWSECSEEEWIAGAEEIAEKYVKLVSYVKDAMIAKINAYANIQLDIGRHFSDLGEREKLLDAARKKLVMESGNALG
ncbi:hypothetical protein BYT27DRAFT_7335092 [Phlegmacium glaucopus]|nr:hypothetical protein BYT27DRAFT_7335092 [Phlegmacium glaucopus]